MVFGIDALATTIDRWFDFLVYSVLVPILVFIFVGLFFLMQFYFIKGYVFLSKEGFKIIKFVLDTYRLRKSNFIQKLLE